MSIPLEKYRKKYFSLNIANSSKKQWFFICCFFLTFFLSFFRRSCFFVVCWCFFWGRGGCQKSSTPPKFASTRYMQNKVGLWPFLALIWLPCWSFFDVFRVFLVSCWWKMCSFRFFIWGHFYCCLRTISVMKWWSKFC